jgi:hypothetical protein
MRPSPADVQQWLTAEVVSDGQLAAYLSVLRDDPNWRFTDTSDESVRTLRLMYYPDGVPADVVLDRIAGGWRPRAAALFPR